MTSPKTIAKKRASVTATKVAPASKPPKRVAREPARPAAKTTVKAGPKVASGSTSHGVAVKPKLVRDSFTMPKTEYSVLEGLKVRAANLTRPVKKSELLRAGVAALSAMGDKAFLAALGKVPSLKTGRPKGLAKTAMPGETTQS